MNCIQDHHYGSESDDELYANMSHVSPAPINITPNLFSLFGYQSASIEAFIRYYGLYERHEHLIPRRTRFSQWRRFCYEYNLFAISFDPPAIQPHQSLDFYRHNAGHLIELRHWVLREMYALSNVVDTVITPQQIAMVMNGILQYNIDDIEFLSFLPPLEPRTEHFMHELISFANSVHNYSVHAYDANVKYDFRNPTDYDNANEFERQEFDVSDSSLNGMVSPNIQMSQMSSNSSVSNGQEESGSEALSNESLSQEIVSIRSTDSPHTDTIEESSSSSESEEAEESSDVSSSSPDLLIDHQRLDSELDEPESKTTTSESSNFDSSADSSGTDSEQDESDIINIDSDSTSSITSEY